MPRTQKKRLGSRQYANYSAETLNECLQNVISRKMTQREAAAHFGIPRSTIKNKLKGNHSKPVGRSRVFTEAEEKAFEQHLIKLADYGFPVVEADFRITVKNYLDKKGVKINIFKNNLPGYEWVKSFLNRHNNLSVRMSSNIKRVRAEVGLDEINSYMDNLSVVLKDIPPSRIWNYDETNLSDDPGNKKVICKRGMKYVEKICNYSKSSTSVMFCGNAEGKCLPSYVVYKAEHMWTTWTEGGPEHARYNRTKSGWFDSITFEDWFEFSFLKEVKHENAPTVLIGDNLSSHINVRVLELCEQNNIKFVCLPPNTTHITQPLDVSFFGPMKKIWRSILTTWKESKSGSKYPTIPKDLFPTLLNELINRLEENKTQNLVSGFKKCGIYPINKQCLLDRLPNNLSEHDNSIISEAFIDQLESKRTEYLGTSNIKRRKKLQVPSGKSITVNDVTNVEDQKRIKTKPIKSKKTKIQLSSSSSDEELDEIILQSDGISDLNSDSDSDDNPTVSALSNKEAKLNQNDLEIDNFVIVLFNGEKYPGRIVSISKKGPVVDCMEKRLKFWRWPQRKDAIVYDWKDVLRKINPPKIVSKRNQFSVFELEDFV